MQNIVKNDITSQDIKNVYETFIGWEHFYNKTIMVTGATGVIGSFIIRCLIHANKKRKLHLKILAVVRDINKGKTFFSKNKIVKLVVQDVNKTFKCHHKVDYIIHCASNTSSASFVEKPVETLDVAVKGTKNILEFAENKKVKSMVYLSSMEVYGELDKDRGLTLEEDLGFIDILKPRSSYQVGKRTAEAYCSYYAKEKNVPVKIVRLAQTVASNIEYSDPRVFAYFTRCVTEKTDIILSTSGETIRSFCYITDVIKALFTVLLKGVNGDCYNIFNEDAIIKIKDFAQLFAEKYPPTKLKFNIKEDAKYPTQTNWQMANAKIKNLGWEPEVSLDEMINRVVSSFYWSKTKSVTTRKSNLMILKKLIKWLFSVHNIKMKKYVKILGKDFLLYDKCLLFSTLNKDKLLKNKIVFNNFYGNLYGCNPKYIAEELIKRNNNVEMVWLCKNVKSADLSSLPNRIKAVEYKKAIKHIADAKIVISNVRMNPIIRKGWIKRIDQKYIQTWHGSLGIKKLDAAVENFAGNKEWIATAKLDSSLMDVIISNSDFETNVFQSDFWYNGEIKLIGHPRNDIFFKSQDEIAQIKNKVLEKLGIKGNKKILLYAPTFRDNKLVNCYQVDTERILKAIKDKFNDDVIFLVRLHPRLTKMADSLFNFGDEVINATEYPDIQELLVISDYMITDYSSCVFDFMLTRKPAFIFATDVALYNNARGLYYPLEATPFPVSQNNDELTQNILNFDERKYKQEVELFLQNKGCMEDGHASERVADLIEEILNNE